MDVTDVIWASFSIRKMEVAKMRVAALSTAKTVVIRASILAMAMVVQMATISTSCSRFVKARPAWSTTAMSASTQAHKAATSALMDSNSAGKRACAKTPPAKTACVRNVKLIRTSATGAKMATTSINKRANALTSLAKFLSAILVRLIPESVSHA